MCKQFHTRGGVADNVRQVILITTALTEKTAAVLTLIGLAAAQEVGVFRPPVCAMEQPQGLSRLMREHKADIDG